MFQEIHSSDCHFDLTSRKILLGAGWIYEEAYLYFQRFPEVLFIDSTHKTNNEGRPLLMIYGRDLHGKGFGLGLHVFSCQMKQVLSTDGCF